MHLLIVMHSCMYRLFSARRICLNLVALYFAAIVYLWCVCLDNVLRIYNLSGWFWVFYFLPLFFGRVVSVALFATM